MSDPAESKLGQDLIGQLRAEFPEMDLPFIEDAVRMELKGCLPSVKAKPLTGSQKRLAKRAREVKHTTAKLEVREQTPEELAAAGKVWPSEPLKEEERNPSYLSREDVTPDADGRLHSSDGRDQESAAVSDQPQ